MPWQKAACGRKRLCGHLVPESIVAREATQQKTGAKDRQVTSLVIQKAEKTLEEGWSYKPPKPAHSYRSPPARLYPTCSITLIHQQGLHVQIHHPMARLWGAHISLKPPQRTITKLSKPEQMPRVGLKEWHHRTREIGEQEDRGGEGGEKIQWNASVLQTRTQPQTITGNVCEPMDPWIHEGCSQHHDCPLCIHGNDSSRL